MSETAARPPAPIIPLHANPAWASSDKFLSAKKDAREALEQAASSLSTALVNLACSGPWKEWSDGLPVGTTIAFDRSDFCAIDHPAAQALIAMIDQLEEAAENL